MVPGVTDEKGVNYTKEMNDYVNINDYIFLGKGLVSSFLLDNFFNFEIGCSKGYVENGVETGERYHV